MDSNQLDSRIEAFMARKMKQFPEIERRYQVRYKSSSAKKDRRQPQVWVLKPSLN